LSILAIAQGDDPAVVAYPRQVRRINLRELVQSLADDLELAFDSGAQQGIGHIVIEHPAVEETLQENAALLDVVE
jgi:hypothetical protein